MRSDEEILMFGLIGLKPAGGLSPIGLKELGGVYDCPIGLKAGGVFVGLKELGGVCDCLIGLKAGGVFIGLKELGGVCDCLVGS